jgi:hypothetical protein
VACQVNIFRKSQAGKKEKTNSQGTQATCRARKEQLLPHLPAESGKFGYSHGDTLNLYR